MADYPDWVLEHKKKGTYINKVGDRYYLYAAHSERVKGTNKVRRVCDGYLGRITKEDGFIPSKNRTQDPLSAYEFGLSFAILSYTGDIRSQLEGSGENGTVIYVAAILQCIYGLYSRGLYEESFLSVHFDPLDLPDTFTEEQDQAIRDTVDVIGEKLSEAMGDDLIAVRAYLSNIRMIRMNGKVYISGSSPTAKELLEKYKIDWSDQPWLR